MPLSGLGRKIIHGIVGDHKPAAKADASVPTTGTPPPTDSYKPIGLPITTLNAELAVNGNQFQVGKHAPPRPVLDMQEIRLAPGDLRKTLVRRFASSLAFTAGMQLGVTSVAKPEEGTAKAGPWSLTSKGGQITLSHTGGQTLTLDASSVMKLDARERTREIVVDAFSHLLAKKGDPKSEKVAASTYLFLLGGSGVLNQIPGKPKAVRGGMQTPKLLAWDFNGTVQGDNGRFRPGMAATVEALKRMGALNILTTSIAPEPAEEAMGKVNIHFDAHFGNGEVRPNSGSKQYEPVANLFGLSADDSRANMVTIGDSATDISGDKAAGLFIHDRFMVPGPAIEQLLTELDRLGNGNFLEGLEAALGGRSLDKTQTVELGSLKFDVSVRPGNADKGGRPVPVIDRLEINLGPLDVANILGSPTPGAIEDSSQWRLAYEHLASTLDEQKVPDALKNLTGDPTAAKEAVERRLHERSEDVAEARKVAGGLKEWLSKPVDFDSAIGQLTDLARVGDPEVSKAVRAAVQSFVADTVQAEKTAMTAIGGQTRALDQLLSPSSVVDMSAQLTRADVKLINRVLEKPELMFIKHKDVVAAFSKLSGDDPQVAELKHKLKKALPHIAAEYKKSLEETFTERKARAGELLPLDGMAAASAMTRPAAFEKISAALSAL